MDSLPVEILGEIAGNSEETYHAIALTMRLFAIGLTPGVIVDWQIHFGHHVKITSKKIQWSRHGKLHRIDGPALIYVYGKFHQVDYNIHSYWWGVHWWYRDGIIHRNGGPAVLYLHGGQRWYRDGKLHRDDGPAEVLDGGTQRWYKDGLPIAPPVDN